MLLFVRPQPYRKRCRYGLECGSQSVAQWVVYNLGFPAGSGGVRSEEFLKRICPRFPVWLRKLFLLSCHTEWNYTIRVKAFFALAKRYVSKSETYPFLPPTKKDISLLAAVNDASRRLRRWPFAKAIIDRCSAFRSFDPVGTRNVPKVIDACSGVEQGTGI
jgi:hypothetical protein